MPGERRQHERFVIRAEAELRRNGTIAHLSARDVSVGGAYLVARLADFMQLRTGCILDLTLTIDEDAPHHAFDDGSTIHARARIVRRDPGGDGRPPGLAVEFLRVDLANRARIQALLENCA
jgi:hypothetical protein